MKFEIDNYYELYEYKTKEKTIIKVKVYPLTDPLSELEFVYEDRSNLTYFLQTNWIEHVKIRKLKEWEVLKYKLENGL